MDRSKRDLESTVSSQKEQLTRYETRLKDVVTAYKGLLKEKEALEASLAASVSSKTDQTPKTEDVSKSSSENLQLQISTLMNSLATLSAEKSRMEASFQGDKKQLRAELALKDKHIQELDEKVKEFGKQKILDAETMKSKLIVERHEREKESNDHMVMLRELQKLLADERHLKENLEMQLNDLKNELSSSANGGEKLIQLSAELKEAKTKIKQIESQRCSPEPENNILQQLQNEMHHLKQQHSIAIKNEQKRAYLAEERNKKLAVLHEDRVANLEARLAELSTTVGTYDRLRQQDQESIHILKEKLSKLATQNEEEKVVDLSLDIPKAVDEILRLKKFILMENIHSKNPFDVNKIFHMGSVDHSQCLQDLEACHREIDDFRQAVEVQKHHIKTLQEKVKVLNQNIEDQEIELKHQSDKLNHAVKAEKTKWTDTLNSQEIEYRSKLNDMEQQLQKQRVRSLQLIDEKENEIKALKTSFEIFVPTAESNGDGDRKITPPKMSLSENCHMIHYANEIARKDVEISTLRKAKYSAETALRQALQDKVTAQEELHDRIDVLEEQVDRLERCKTREGANLEYLKNVIISFLSTRNLEGKRHMINAIGAVLQFTPAEVTAINCIFSKK